MTVSFLASLVVLASFYFLLSQEITELYFSSFGHRQKEKRFSGYHRPSGTSV